MLTKTASGIPYWQSRDPIQERGGINIYGFVGNDALNFTDYLGWIYKDNGVERVKSIFWGNVLGFTDAKGVLITRCICRNKNEEKKVWRTQLMALFVHTKIFVRTHMSTMNEGKLIHIQRPEKYILATIEHERIHVKIVKNWHDQSEPIIQQDFAGSNTFSSFEECEEYRKNKVKSWRNSWFLMKKGQHGRPEFDNDPSLGSGVKGIIFESDPDGEKEFWRWQFEAR